ncbi:MAG: response regulator transcription factor [Methylotenera sp.]|nr:response regulator transcription factor [Methylotenera sp.]
MKVLLVEDSVLIRNALMEILVSSPDLTIDGIAATQNNAIALLDEKQFDMLLVDIELAQGNGFEVIRHTQREGYPFSPPVFVMLTNHAHPQYRTLAKNLGVKHFFDKSMDFDLAIETIETEAARFSNHTSD